jgi:hypothetical protein
MENEAEGLEQSRRKAEEFEESRRKAIDTAFQTLKNLRDFPSVQVEVMEAGEDIRKAAPGWPLTNLPTSTRLEYALKMLRTRCSAYLKLVSDIVTQEAYTTMLHAFVRSAWEEFIGMSGVEPLPGNREFQAIEDEGMRWHKESYRRLIPSQSLQAVSEQLEAPRRGYRNEVRAWMVREQIQKLDTAAKILGISKSALKSIMSDKGTPRYGVDALRRVLQRINAPSTERKG